MCKYVRMLLAVNKHVLKFKVLEFIIFVSQSMNKENNVAVICNLYAWTDFRVREIYMRSVAKYTSFWEVVVLQLCKGNCALSSTKFFFSCTEKLELSVISKYAYNVFLAKISKPEIIANSSRFLETVFTKNRSSDPYEINHYKI